MLLFAEDVKTLYSFKLKNIYHKDHHPFFITFIGQGAQGLATMWFWPLLLFFLIPGFVVLGAVAFVVNLIAIFLSLFIG
jgi:hypothetical protein